MTINSLYSINQIQKVRSEKKIDHLVPQPKHTLYHQLSVHFIDSRDENGSDMDGYHRYYICFHISIWIRIRIRIVSTMSDMIRLDIDIINMQFEYSDTVTVSDVEYPDSNTDGFEPL